MDTKNNISQDNDSDNLSSDVMVENENGTPNQIYNSDQARTSKNVIEDDKKSPNDDSNAIEQKDVDILNDNKTIHSKLSDILNDLEKKDIFSELLNEIKKLEESLDNNIKYENNINQIILDIEKTVKKIKTI